MSDEYFKKLLQKNYRQLTDDLEVKKVVTRLFERGVLDVEDKDDIEEEPNRTKGAKKLLGKLMRMGEENFITFCEVLGELPSQKHLEKVLRRRTNEGCACLPRGIQEQQCSLQTACGQHQESNSCTTSNTFKCNPPRFIGRQNICNSIVNTILDGVFWLIILVAPPGFGKSTVATSVGHMLLENGYQVLHFSLRNVHSVAKLASDILDSFGLSSSQCEDPLKKLSRFLKGVTSKTVLVLDNAEDLQEDETEKEFTDLVKEIGENMPNIYVFITTRKEVRGLSRCNFLHKSFPLEALNEEDSAKLLQLLVSHISMEQACSLGKCCGGVPLFLNIAGSLLENDTTAEPLIEELEMMPERFLKGSNPDIKDYHDCLKIFIKWMRSEMRSALTRLAVFPTTFSEDEARFLFHDVKSNYEFHSLLITLKGHALLQFDDKTKEYSLHPLVHVFCKVTKDDNELDTRYNVAEDMFIRHYLELVRSLHLQFIGKQSKDAIKKYEKNKINIQHAMLSSVKWKQVELQHLGIDVSTEVIDFLAKVLRTHEFQKIYHTMEDVARRLGDDKRYSDCLTSIGFREICYCGRRGLKADDKRKNLATAHRIQKELGGDDREPRAHCLCKLGVRDVYAGNIERGVQRIARGISMRKRLAEKVRGPVEQMALAAGYSDLAVVFDHLGKHNAAVSIWRNKTLTTYRSLLNYHPFTATLLEYIATSMAHISFIQHEEEAIRFMRQSLDMRINLLGEEHFDTARGYFGMGRVLSKFGYHREALNPIDHALELFRKIQVTDQEIENSMKERDDIEEKAKKFERLIPVVKRRLEHCEYRNNQLQAPSL